MQPPIVLGITGASGAIYAVRLLEVLREAGRDVHLSISSSGRDVLEQELNLKVDTHHFDPDAMFVCSDPDPHDERVRLLKTVIDSATAPTAEREQERAQRRLGNVDYYRSQDFMAPMASGSFQTAGMVICPCSGTTLSAVAIGSASNLIQRAAEVHLKERRKLILVPREAPLSLAHIDNMRRVTEAGAIVLPASPGWYHGVVSIRDLVDFVVGRICDQLDIEHGLTKRWGS